MQKINTVSTKEPKYSSVDYHEGAIDAYDKVVEYLQTYQTLQLEIPLHQWLTTMCYTERACAVLKQGNILADMEESQTARK